MKNSTPRFASIFPAHPAAAAILCYVTDRSAFSRKRFLHCVRAVLESGVEFVQIREKFTPTNELMDLCREVMQLPRQRLQKIIMNDRLDIALAFGLDGVHLGGNSFPVLEVRRNTPKTFIIGVSIHHWKEAVMAEREGANYAVFGPIYPTPSKLGYGPPQGIEKLREVVQMVSIPILAIGGISLGNYRECLNAGAAGIAAISLFQDSRTVKRVVEKIRTGK